MMKLVIPSMSTTRTPAEDLHPVHPPPHVLILASATPARSAGCLPTAPTMQRSRKRVDSVPGHLVVAVKMVGCLLSAGAQRSNLLLQYINYHWPPRLVDQYVSAMT